MKMKNIIYSWTSFLVIALMLSACEDDYTVKVSPGPGKDVNVTLSPGETITFTEGANSTDITVMTNMPDSTITVASGDTAWCKVSVAGNIVKVRSTENLKYISRSAFVTIKVFSVTKKVEVVQDAKTYVSDPVYPINKNYKIAVPALADFSTSKMFKVMDGDQKIAEICLEYLKNSLITSRAVVVYVGAGGAADYTNGFVAYLVDNNNNITSGAVNGGHVIFDYVNNTFDYAAGTSNAIGTVYINGYGVTKDELADVVELTPVPYTVRDISGNSYPVVKIGCEVWLGSNLCTTKFGDGTVIDLITSSSFSTYNKTVPFATYPRGDATLDKSVFGYLYNGAVVKGDNEALIGSSIIDGNWRLSTGGGSNGTGINGITTDWQRLFKYVGNDQLGTLLSTDYSWSSGGAGSFDIQTVSNLTGMSLVAAGEYYDVSNYDFVIGGESQAFVFYGGGGADGYNLAEADGKALDQAGVRVWPHESDACAIRLVRVDTHVAGK
jgi:hypothetical protein